MREGFTAGQVSLFTGIPYDRLDYWCRTRFITPSISVASGKGSDRLFSFADLRTLRTAWELRELGVSLRRLRLVVSFLQRIDVPLAEARLVVVGDDVQLARSDGELLSLLRAPGQFRLPIVILDIGAIEAELLDGTRSASPQGSLYQEATRARLTGSERRA